MNPHDSNNVLLSRMRVPGVARAARTLLAAMAMMLCPTVAWGQSLPAATRTATAPSGSAASRLAGIAGVTADMSNDKLIDLAQQISQAGRYQDAEKIFTEVIRLDPRNLRAYQAAAQMYEIQAAAIRSNPAATDAARAEADKLVAQAVETYVKYAAPLALEQGNPETAEQIYKTVLQQERYRYEPRAMLGMARLLDAKGSLQAIDRYKTYINPRLCPKGAEDSKAHLELGRIYYNRRYLNQAVSTLEKAHELDRFDPDILLQLARAYQDSGMRPKALDMVRQAINTAPANPAYRDAHAQVLMAQAVSAEGTATPESARQILDLAMAESAAAISGAEAAVKSTPGDRQRLAVLQSCYATRQQILSRLLKGESGDVRILVEMAACGRRLADITRLLALHSILAGLLAANEAVRGNVTYLEAVAELQFELQMLAAAGETCKRLQSQDPANQVARRILGQISTASAPASRAAPATGPSGAGR